MSIPVRLEDLSAEWVQGVLEGQGLLGSGVVRGVRASPVGDARGFMGNLYRLELELAGGDGSAPSSVIAKLPTTARIHRSLGTVLGIYEREVQFYRRLAPGLPIRTPRALYAELDVEASEQELAKFERANGLPRQLITPWVSWQLMKAGFRGRRRYGLLLEDLGHAEVEDQVAGCGVESAALVLHDAAHLHGHHWNEAGLEGMPWLRPFGEGDRVFAETARKGRPKFLHFFAEQARGLAPALEFATTHSEALMAYLGARPQTLCHGDLRLDNAFFVGTGDQRRAVLVDWQMVRRGPGAFDVAYFVAESVREDVPEEAVTELLRDYHETLTSCGAGAAGYAFEELVHDYAHGLMFVLLWLLAGSATLNLAEDEALHRLLRKVVARLSIRLSAIDHGTLLKPHAAG